MIWPGSAASIADWMLPPGCTDMVALLRLESIAIMAIRISPLHIAGRELSCMSAGLISEHKRMIVTESGLCPRDIGKGEALCGLDRDLSSRLCHA